MIITHKLRDLIGEARYRLLNMGIIENPRLNIGGSALHERTGLFMGDIHEGNDTKRGYQGSQVYNA